MLKDLLKDMDPRLVEGILALAFVAVLIARRYVPDYASDLNTVAAALFGLLVSAPRDVIARAKALPNAPTDG